MLTIEVFLFKKTPLDHISLKTKVKKAVDAFDKTAISDNIWEACVCRKAGRFSWEA
ncbi:MAG: hypothetical protein VB050_16805 [Geobacteraceae bacterium]|nr:hypothetical protein [Geobacteraceae bacterium]